MEAAGSCKILVPVSQTTRRQISFIFIMVRTWNLNRRIFIVSQHSSTTWTSCLQAPVASWHYEGTVRVVCQADCCRERSEAMERQHVKCLNKTGVPSWLLSCVQCGNRMSTYKVPTQDILIILHWSGRVKDSCLPVGGPTLMNCPLFMTSKFVDFRSTLPSSMSTGCSIILFY